MVEFQGRVKLIFAGHGTRADALATIVRAHTWAVRINADNITAAEKFAESDG